MLGLNRAENEAQLATALVECGVPEHDHWGLIHYILDGIPPGHFMTAVLSNDLKEACSRADEENQSKLWNIVYFLYNNAPIACWGSSTAVNAWLSSRQK